MQKATPKPPRAERSESRGSNSYIRPTGINGPRASLNAPEAKSEIARMQRPVNTPSARKK